MVGRRGRGAGRSAVLDRGAGAAARAQALAPLAASAVSLLAATMIVVAGYAGSAVLALGLVMLVLVLAAGWPVLLSLPDPIGSAALVALTGLGAVGVGMRPPEPDRPLAGFAVLLSLSVIAAFGHELVRRDGRNGPVRMLAEDCEWLRCCC